MTTNWMMILVKKVFTFFSPKSSVCHARLRAGLFIQETAYGGLSYKARKKPWITIQGLELGYKDSNLEMTESESVALPFGDSPLSFVLCFFSVSLSDKMYYIAPLRKMQVFF